MIASLLFDDSLQVSDQARQLAGLRAYGDLLFRGKRHADRMESAARAAGWTEFVRMRDLRDVEEEAHLLRTGRGAQIYLYVPASIAWSGDEAELESFLRNLLLAQVNVRVQVDGAALACADPEAMVRVLSAISGRRRNEELAETVGGLPEIRTPPELVNLAGAPAFVAYLTGSFAVRHFNSIENDRYTVKKVSTDCAKLKREFDYFSLLPPSMRMYFVSAFDFQQDHAAASYRMERVFAPDVAIQWVHGSLDPAGFASLLDRLFHYLATRARRKAESARGRQIADDLYLTKVVNRLDMLRADAKFAQLDTLIRQFEGMEAGLAGLQHRYEQLYKKLGRSRSFDSLEIGHGDLCFSNILYARDTELMKFVDVRGASSEDEMYTDGMYDLAKLSHSILGRYDYINNGVFGLEVDDRAHLKLQVDEHDQAAMKAIFLAKVEQANYDPRVLRLYEASLFLSMLPLHIDKPKKVLAYCATAQDIMDWVESN